MVPTVSLDVAEGGDRKGDLDGISEMSLLLINHTQLFILSFLLSSLHLEHPEIQMLPVLHRTATCPWPFKHLQVLPCARDLVIRLSVNGDQ